MDSKTVAKLKTEIRKQLKAGHGPCAAMRKALIVLDIKGYGVQGDDDEIARFAEDHFEMHAADGSEQHPLLACNLINNKWTV